MIILLTFFFSLMPACYDLLVKFALRQCSCLMVRLLRDLQNLIVLCNSGIKDVRANCFCASLLRTQIHMPRHATSYIERAR